MKTAKSIRILCFLLLVTIGNIAFGRDYTFSISFKKEVYEVSEVYSLTYSNNRVKINMTATILGTFDTGTLAEYGVKSPTIDQDGVIWFKDSSGNKAACVFCNSNGHTGYFKYRADDGKMYEIKTVHVSTDFWQNYVALKKIAQPGSSSSGKNTRPQQPAKKPRQPTPAKTPARFNSGSSSNSSDGLIAINPELSPATFASHPFGFLPESPQPQATVVSQLRNAGWKANPYDETLLSIMSPVDYKIPFKMFGKPVTKMSMSWYKGKCSNYDLEIGDYKTAWTEAEAKALADKIYSSLLNNGYRATEVKFPYSGHFFEKAVTDGRVYVQIDAGSNSKVNVHDSYYVTMNVRYD